MDTPRTNLGDATFLSRAPPDFDMTQEPSFHTPPKQNNLLHQMRNGRGVNLRTPRGNRAPLGDKRNLPTGIPGPEFTPMLKSATRNSARRFGKENTNGLATPALGKINEDADMVPVESSLFGPSRNLSYVQATPGPDGDNTSDASTPLILPARRGGNKGPLQDGNQLSLREQENVIDRIEKENFGLKLKIHFLEDALRKAGPGFSEAALKENTELKVDKVTMQRELSKFKKQLASAESDLEVYQQQILEVQQKAKKKYADESQKAENEALRRSLQDKDAEIEELQRRLQSHGNDQDRVDKLQDDIGDLEADLREKDREINNREEEVDELKTKLEEAEDKWKTAQERVSELEEQAQPSGDAGKIDELQEKIADLETDLKEKDQDLNDRDEELNELEEKLNQAEDKLETSQRRVIELEREAPSGEELAEAKVTIQNLETNVRHLEQQLASTRDELQRAVAAKNRAEKDLEELQEEMSNKSVATKGLSRQLDEKYARLQEELRHLEEKCLVLEREARAKDDFVSEVKSRAEQLLQQRETWEHERQQLASKLESAQRDLSLRTDEKNLLQLRHDALGDESASLQRDVARLQKQIDDLEDSLDREKTNAQQIELDMKHSHQAEVDRLNDDLADLQDEIDRVRQEASGGQSASASLEREVTRLQKRIGELERDLDQEKSQSARTGRDAEQQHKLVVDRLNHNITDLQEEVERVRKEASGGQSASASLEREVSRLQRRVNELETSLEHEKANTRVRQSTSGDETASLHREIARLRGLTRDLELNLDQEKGHTLQVEKDVRTGLKSEIDRLNEEVSELQANLRNRDNFYNNDNDKWRSEKRDLESQRDRLEERAAGLQRTIDRLRDAEGTLSGKEMKLQDALDSEVERHRSEESALTRQLDELRHELENRQSMLSKLRSELATVRDDLGQSQLECRTQAEKIEALEDEVEVLQATLDEESEDSSQRLREADQALQELRRQLELAKRDQLERAGRLGELQDADQIAEELREQLGETRQKLREAEHECDHLKRQVERSGRHEAKQSEKLDKANKTVDELKQKLARATKESKKASMLCEDLRSQLSSTRQDLAHASPLCEELRAKLDRARSERAAYRASAKQLESDCARLKAGAEQALAWIQAKNAEAGGTGLGFEVPTEIKRGAMATFRYGDVVLDVVDQKDHEAVIRAADAATRRHAKEVRGLELQMRWMQARWEREANLRCDAAFAKGFLQLQLELAQACNKADLRILARIHQELGMPTPDALLSSSRRKQQKQSQRQSAFGNGSRGSKTDSTKQNLKTFVIAVRAVARMRIAARQWGEHEKTRRRLQSAWEEVRRQA